MNTIGKILVVLNFLFAVCVGVFLVFDFAIRTKWREAYKALETEVKIVAVDRDTTSKAAATAINDVKQRDQEIVALRQKLKDSEVQTQALEDAYKAQLDALGLRLSSGDLSLQEAVKTKQRLVDEIAELNKMVKAREAEIVKLDADVKSIRIIAVSSQSLAQTRQQQNELLLERLSEAVRKIALLEAGAKDDGGVRIAQGGLNPPAVKVKGRINKVDAVDNTLVEISLGTDHGIRKDHTLEVYRFHPEPKYLGVLRIVDAYQHKSVARLINSGGGKVALLPRLQLGDEVATQIMAK